MSIQQFCLRWNNHQPNFISVFTNMLNNEFLVDVTLAAEGKELHAHKIILSACSVYFQNLFATYPKKHAIVIMKDIKYTDLRIIVDFMYYGEVNVSEEQLADVLDTAKLLKIKGLTEMPESTSVTKSQSMSSERADLLTPGESSWGSDVRRQSLSPCHMSPSMRRKRSASIEKAPDKINADNSVVKNPDMKITLSLNQNQQHLKNKCKESQVSTYHTPRDSLDENGGIGNVVSLHNVDEGPSNFMPRETDLNIEEPSAAHLQQQELKVNAPSAKKAKRYRFLTRQSRIMKGVDYVLEKIDVEQSAERSLKTVGRQMSEPIQQTTNFIIPPSLLKKQMSHPLPSGHSVKSSPVASTSAYTQLKIRFDDLHKPSLKNNSDKRTQSDPGSVDGASDGDQVFVEGEVSSWPPGTKPLDFREYEDPTETVENQEGRHCPVVRDGAALSCNYCWNTLDENGRISRRKTKYHCPDCKLNLCIVPCFHKFHGKQSNEETQ